MSARILVVEDDADLHIGLAIRLQSAGHKVLSAMSGEEVQGIALREQPDMILLDIGLPGMDGHAVAAELGGHEETAAIPIIYLTARHEFKHRVDASATGAAAYLTKPCMPDQLLRAVDAVAGQKRKTRFGLREARLALRHPDVATEPGTN
jgi:DNA-binding response OmpR family regulator